MTKKMIALMGEQPIPNLLPILYDKPGEVLLVETSLTSKVRGRLEKILKPNISVFHCQVDPYNFSEIYGTLANEIKKLGWSWSELVFNLTGGTKPMAFAAYQLALDRSECQFLYLESEAGQSRLRQYEFADRLATLKRNEIIPGLITIDDYVRAHLDEVVYHQIAEPFEATLFEALTDAVDEVVAAVKDRTGTLDLDLMVRAGNQVGIIQAKTGSKGRRIDGINHLNTAGGRAYLGTYTKKFLIVDSSWERHTNLSELAQARGIVVIQLPSYGETGQLTHDDRQHLIQMVRKTLGVGNI